VANQNKTICTKFCVGQILFHSGGFASFLRAPYSPLIYNVVDPDSDSMGPLDLGVKMAHKHRKKLINFIFCNAGLSFEG
jgi:hypothetical protein